MLACALLALAAIVPVYPPDGLVPAILAAADGDTLLLASGTYYPTATTLFGVDVTKSITIRASTTGGATIDGQDSFTPFRIRGTGPVVLEGLNITHGRGMEGGGMFVKETATSVTVNFCTFFNNVGLDAGGGAFIRDTASQSMNIVFNDCQFDGNQALESGGGAVLIQQVNAGSTAVFNRCSFTNNAATSAGGGTSGGGLKVKLFAVGTTTLHTTVFRANRAGGSGGGISVQGGSLFATATTVTDNTAGAFGGGIDLFWHDEARFDVCDVARNRADGAWGGGGFWIGGGRNAITSCSITENSAAYAGGGLAHNDGTTTLMSTLIDANNASRALNVNPSSGLLYYKLPLWPGHWLPNSKCIVNRDGCMNTHDGCEATRELCAVTAGDSSVDWMPTVTNADGVTYRCKAPIALVQPCDYQQQPELLGTKVPPPPHSAHIGPTPQCTL